ncbi:ABC transporter permease [Rhodoferax sp. 4810]|nr:ABC transporter permease [Rhodoferax jenense]
MQAHPVLAVCSVLGLGAAWLLPLLRVAPNRLVSGEPVYLASLLPVWGWLMALPLLALIFAPSKPEGASSEPSPGLLASTLRLTILPILMALGIASMFWLAGTQAQQVAQTQSSLARTSLGAGFWCLVALAWLMSLDSVQRLSGSGLARRGLLALVAAPTLLLLALGVGKDLSILKEYVNRDEVFWLALWRHLQIVAAAIVPSVLLGLPLAWACTRRPGLRQWLFPLLNIVQTVPSIALFGLFMAPLAWLALQFPGLAQAGISGVGLAPAVFALVLYSLLPIVRSALAGLEQVQDAAKTAALAMGMSERQIFWHVQLPLALPVLLPGLRAAVVQTIGLTAVTALVGAGGLGSLMFDGLFSAANDLVLLGVLPIVLLAMLADALFKAMIALAQPPGFSDQDANAAVLTQVSGQTG